LHDPAAAPGRSLIGLAAVPAASLANRAVAYLESGPAPSAALLRDVLGLGRAPRRIADQVARCLVGDDPRVVRIADGRWALAAAAGSPALEACRFAVVDVESTGWHPGRGGRIMEIAVVEVQGGAVRPRFETLVDPQAPVSPFATRLTGITGAALRGAPTFAGIADGLVRALAGAVFVAHNARFDWMFIAAELERERGLLLQGPRLCTLRLSRRLVRNVAGRRLDRLTDYFGIQNRARHRAGGDAEATAHLLVRLLDLAKARGAVTLGDLMRVRGAECGVRDESTRANPAPRTPHSAL